MNIPTIFTFKNHQVRTIEIDGQIWFIAIDVAKALDYKDSAQFTRWLDDDEMTLHIVQGRNGNRELPTINESGLYSAILRSRKPEAKRFKKWVTSEVLPAIRKTGRYEATPTQPPARNTIHLDETRKVSMADAVRFLENMNEMFFSPDQGRQS